jgi:hypothetical protein
MASYTESDGAVIMVSAMAVTTESDHWYSAKNEIKHTSQSKGGLPLAALRLHALQQGRIQFGCLVFYLCEGVSAHEEVDIRCESSFSTLNAASLPVNNLFQTVCELLLPRLGCVVRDVQGDHLIDGVDAGFWSAMISRVCIAASTYLQFVLSLILPSSSSEPWRLWLRELARELAAEEVREDMRDWAFLDTVLPLSSAWRRRSCMVASVLGDITKVIIFSFQQRTCVRGTE